jgi:hypothetical protein
MSSCLLGYKRLKTTKHAQKRSKIIKANQPTPYSRGANRSEKSQQPISGWDNFLFYAYIWHHTTQQSNIRNIV